MTLVDPLSPVTLPKGIKPLNQIAFYHGLQNGFYFGFLVTFTAFMLPLAVVGIGAFLFDRFYEQDPDSSFQK
jgi:hypothetical protein